jgi:DNA-binding LacI/PurR family transcriptional regulator
MCAITGAQKVRSHDPTITQDLNVYRSPLCISLATSAEQIAPVLPWRRPVVVFERTMPNVNVDALEIDNFQRACHAPVQLLDLGHWRLGCTAGLANSNRNGERIATYQHELARRGIPFHQALPRTRGYMLAAWVRESLVSLRLRELPTAIFAFNGLMAMRVMRAVRERSYGYRLR